MSEENQNPSTPAPEAPATATPAAPKRQAAAPQASKAPAKAAGPVMAMPRNRHEISFRHDVFKSDIKKCLKNMSYEHLKFEKLEVEHVHIFHSHKNDGRRLTRTNSSNGHWHNVEHIVDEHTGATRAVCGPPMHEVTKVSETGRTFTVVEQVSFAEEITVGEAAGQKRTHVDDHRHELIYIGSEELSPAGIASALKEQRALAAAMGMNLDPSAVKDNSPKPMNPGDGASIS